MLCKVYIYIKGFFYFYFYYVKQISDQERYKLTSKENKFEFSLRVNVILKMILVHGYL